MNSATDVLATVQALLTAVKQLESLYPGRSFTLDGHLVGSIGEVLAAELYGLKLLPPSTEGHDALCPEGRSVQVKLTQVRRVAMYSQPEYLLVLRLNADGRVEEVYNGPGPRVWASCGKPQKNGQRSISIGRLRALNVNVAAQDKLARRIAPAWLADA